MKIIGLFAIVFLNLVSCSSNKVQQETKKYIEKVTFQNWVGGIKGAGGGTIININLQKGDLTNSEKFLNKALAIDPKNKQLYYVLGTSYIDLKENEKAEEALIKAIEIDPNYTEAQYQLGAHLFNWANDLKTGADQLDLNDPKAPLLVQKSEETLNRALVVLEKYILINPNEKAVLDILWKSYYKLGNDVKSAEYKKRAQEIK